MRHIPAYSNKTSRRAQAMDDDGGMYIAHPTMLLTLPAMVAEEQDRRAISHAPIIKGV